jgi:hypothetical protein
MLSGGDMHSVFVIKIVAIFKRIVENYFSNNRRKEGASQGNNQIINKY